MHTCSSGLPRRVFSLDSFWYKQMPADKLIDGHIPHALIMMLPMARVVARDIPAANTSASLPTTHSDGATIKSYAIHVDQRLRLSTSPDLDALDLHPICRTIAKVFQEYGAFITDRSGAVDICAQNLSMPPDGIYESVYAGVTVYNTIWSASRPGGDSYQPFPWSELQLPLYTIFTATIKLRLQ